MSKNRSIICVAALLSTLLFATGCATRTAPETPAAAEWPEWYQVYEPDESLLFGFGEGRSTQPNLAMQQARLAARAELAEQISVHIQALTQQGAQQALDSPATLGSLEAAQRALVERSLAGSRPDRVQRQREADGSVRVFVRMSAPRDEAALAGQSALTRMDQLLEQRR